jgi:hypothetical protein
MKNVNKQNSNACVPRLLESPAFSKKTAIAAAVLGALFLATHSPQSSAAQQNNIVGEVERIIVDNPADKWSRGTMVVAGQNIIIPRNMVIDLPANRMTLQEFFVNRPSACPPNETGLAKADSCNSSFTGATVDMLANKTNNGNVVAGYVMLEKATELVSGIVSYINYDEGYFRVDGDPGNPATTGAMVRVNDPEGRFTHQQGLGCAGSGPNCSADIRYGVDPDNYTFTASTGYPMCIPSTVERTYDFDVDKSTVIEPDETGLTAVAAADGSGDALCPQSNRGTDPVGDSRLFAPIQVGDHVNAEGNFENIDGVTFLSAHTVGVSVGLTTDETAFQPDYMIFDEVGWDVPGFQNQRVRDLLIAFGTLGTTQVDVFGLYYDPANNGVEELVFATTAGCEIAAGAGTCTNQGIVGNTAVFKIVHDVDFILGVPIDPRRSPCQQLNAAYTIGGGIPDKNGTLVTVDPKGRCTGTITLGDEFEVLSPPSRDLIGRSRHKHALHPSVVTLDFHGTPSQNGEYLNPVGIGHPEFVEINLAALQTPLIFAGEPWNLDRRLGPGGGCDGEPECDTTTPIGDPSMSLEPFPYSSLDPGTQAGAPGVGGVPLVTGYGPQQRNRTLTYWPFIDANHDASTAKIMQYPPTDPVGEPITATLHANLSCGVDDDGDGILNDVDNCPATFNPGQEDVDLDGVGDFCDNCSDVANGTLLPLGASALSQRDTDSDGFGNMCDADLNNSGGTVNLSDYSLFRSAFGANVLTAPLTQAQEDADFNGDGAVNLSDYSSFRRLFGKTPGPSGL